MELSLSDRNIWPRCRAYFKVNMHINITVTQPSTVAKRLARHFAFGRSRVLTPVPPDQVWVFFRSFPTPSHRGMSHITDKANVQYLPLPPSFRTHPHRIFPSVSLKELWKASAARAPLRGGMKFFSVIQEYDKIIYKISKN
jgi:hypothetical protein